MNLVSTISNGLTKLRVSSFTRHIKLTNAELILLFDELNFIIHSVQQNDCTCNTFKQLQRGDGTLLSSEHQLKLNEFYGKEGQIWTLIYKATRDGFSASDFHRCCDNQDSTITVIQSTEGGYLFGGYTSVSWRSTEGYVLDPNNPFLFTLTNPHGIPSTKYSNKHSNYSIYAGNNYGPTFGGAHDLYISNNSQTNRNNYFGFPHSYNDTTNRGALTFTGDQNFRTNEIEVYRLIET
ncbi:unnamed protein product [Rotaria sordida]|uniref:TLDc domain-containing protein n=1 Tax=Rotaria sordida TaxID=392033 RepID=A0A814WH58_9BILA|nr:unnamed protein product [Rotaria sordida]